MNYRSNDNSHTTNYKNNRSQQSELIKIIWNDNLEK